MGGPKPEPFARPQAPGPGLQGPLSQGLQGPGLSQGLGGHPQSRDPEPSVLRAPGRLPENLRTDVSAIPEWAKAALAAPGPEKPKHFAQSQDAELAIPVPTTYLPKIERLESEARPEKLEARPERSEARLERSEARLERSEARPEKPEAEDATKRLTIVGSPRTSRRRKEVSEDLVFN